MRCGRCDRDVPEYDLGVLEIETGPIEICSHCFCREAVMRMGLDFDPPVPRPITFNDAAGRERTFYCRLVVLPSGLMFEAFEIRDDEREGYEFAVEGDFDRDPMDLYSELLDRIRRGVGRRHFVDGRLADDVMVVRGRFSWDNETNGEFPCVVVDGEEMSWGDLGRALEQFEGWQFRLEIKDETEDLE